MYNPTKLKIVNLLSHKETEYDFIDGKAILVVGENNDDDGQESNGAGKSGLIEGISVAITGKPFRNVKDQDLIYYGEDECLVEMHFRNDILSEDLSIHRHLYAKKSKSSTLQVILNKEDQKKAFPGVREGNAWILDKLGISREDLINYYVVSKSKSLSFFGQSDTEKKKIVSRFSGTDSLIPIKDEIKQDIKDIEVLKEEENKLIRLQGRAEAFAEQLEESSTEDAEKAKQARIDQRVAQIANYEKSIVLAKSEYDSLNNNWGSVGLDMQEKEEGLAAFKASDFTAELDVIKEVEDGVTAGIKSLNESIAATKTDLDGFIDFKREIERNIADSIECPKCKHTFVVRDKTYNVEEAKAQLPDIDAMIESFNNTLAECDVKMKAFKEDVAHIASEYAQVRSRQKTEADEKAKLEGELRSAEADLQRAKLARDGKMRTIDQYKANITELKDEIEVISEQEIIDPSLEILKKIAQNNDEVREIETALDEMKDRYVKMKEFEVIFSKFITHLSNKAVKSIEIKTNEYLSKMGSNLSIEIEGYKVNSDNSIKEKFTTVVARDGIPEAFLENFSEGEQSRIVIAGTLAVNSLLNMSCGYGKGLNLRVLDELMGSLDRLGVQNVMESLNELKQTILAISHVEPRQPYQNTIKIIKEGGSSRIEL